MRLHATVVSVEGTNSSRAIAVEYSEFQRDVKLADRIVEFVTRRANSGYERAQTLLNRWEKSESIMTPDEIIAEYLIDMESWEHPVLIVEYRGEADTDDWVET